MIHKNGTFKTCYISAPLREPEDVRIVSLSPTSFLLEWDPPLEEDRNGVLTGYRLVLEWEVGQEYRVNTTHTSYNFTQLQQGTTYYCAVAAYTAIGTGHYYRTNVSTPIAPTPMTLSSQQPSLVATNSDGIMCAHYNHADSNVKLLIGKGRLTLYTVGGGVGGLLVMVIVIGVLLAFLMCKRKKIRTQ